MNAYQKLNQLAGQVTGEIIAQLQHGKAVWQKQDERHYCRQNQTPLPDCVRGQEKHTLRSETEKNV